MAIMHWDPWGELAMLQRDVNQLLGRPGSRRNESLIPPMDAFRTAEGLTVRMELPGLRADDVDISVNDGMLTIAGERKLDADVAEDAWIVRERPVGRFERSFSLAKGTDPSAISAAFTDGVLQLTIPAPPEHRPHKVQINTGGQQSQDTVELN